MRLIGLSAALFAASCTCGPDPGGEELAAAADSGAVMGVTGGPGTAIVGVSVFDPKYCASISGTVAVDGAVLARYRKGGWAQTPRWTGQLLPCPLADCLQVCEPSSWTFRQIDPADDPPSSLIQIVDGSRSWAMSVEHLFARRSIVQSTESPTVFLVTPQTDLLLDPMIGLTSSDGGLVAVEAAYDAGTLTLITPLPPGDYQFSSLQFEAHVLACVGPRSCRASSIELSPVMTFTIPP